MENIEHKELFNESDEGSLQAKIEALLFASPKALSINDILEILKEENLAFKEVKQIILQLIEFHNTRKGGFNLEVLEEGQYQFRSSPKQGSVIERLFARRPRPISRAAQETLAIVAYRQPVSRSDIEFIRGIDSGSILKNLLERELVSCVGRKDIPGKPMLFGTTSEFLRVYGLKSLEELPALESFQPRRELLQAAGEVINEAETPPQEEGLL